MQMAKTRLCRTLTRLGQYRVEHGSQRGRIRPTGIAFARDST